MATLQTLTISDTGNITLPNGTSGQRPTVNYSVQSFTTIGTTSWTAPTGVTRVEVLVVAGGGAGHNNNAGGGGGGGLIYNTNFPVTPGTSYTVTVGAGGTGVLAGAGDIDRQAYQTGGNSVFGTLTAIGGGGGSCWNRGQPGGDGGSGGGGSGQPSQFYNLGGVGTPGQGSNGGQGSAVVSGDSGGGGGGGAGGVGVDANWGGSSGQGGDGGPGMLISITGTPTWYSAGGGGGGGGGGQGGLGGAGQVHPAGRGGSNSAPYINAQSAAANTGNGGGGGDNSNGGNGGSGIVVVRYALTSASTNPAAQTRFNTTTGAIEAHSNHAWVPSPVDENIVTNGLFVHLDANKYLSGSTWTDLSGNGRDATLINSPTFTNDNGLGYFNFVAASAQTANITFDARQDFSAEIWVQHSDTSSFGFFGQGTTAVNDGMHFLMYSNNTTIRMGMYGNDTDAVQIQTVVNTWYQYVFVYRHSDGIKQIFRNGNRLQEAVMSGPGIYTGTGAFRIGGNYSTGGTYAQGKIANVKIYNRRLSHADVKQNFNALAPRFGLAPITAKPAFVQDEIVFSMDAGAAEGYPRNDRYWRDSTSNRAHIVLQNSPTYSFDNGGCLVFDGANDYAQVYAPNVDLRTFMSYEVWIYVSSYHSPNNRTYLIDPRGDGVDSGCNSYFLFDYQGGSNVTFTTGNSGVEVTSPSVTMALNLWHHVVSTRSGNVWTIYLNGQRIHTGTSNFTELTLNNTFRVGTYSGWNLSSSQYMFNGKLAVARMYKKALSGSEVQQNFGALKTRYGR